jgi:hypothetical protein
MSVDVFFCLRASRLWTRTSVTDGSPGVLDDTVLGMNGSDIESISSETCNCHTVSTESELEIILPSLSQDVCKHNTGR